MTDIQSRRRHAAPAGLLPVRLLARVLIGVLVPLLGVAWLVNSSDVTLQVDGQPQALTTYARTVDELLQRAGVAYTDDDQVVPGPATPLRDGMLIEVVHAREITLLIGGEEKTILVTALSVDDVIAGLGDRRGVTDRSIVRPSRLMPVTSGMTVEVLNPVPVTVLADGKAHDVVTDAPNVAGVLQGLDITLGRRDRVRPSGSTGVTKGMRIAVERVKVRRDVREEAIAYETQQRTTDELQSGETREVQPGREGLAEVTQRVRFVNGAEVSRTTLSRRVVTEPQPRIVESGTGTPPPPPRRAAPAASRDRDRDRDKSPAPARTQAPEPQPEPTTDSRTQTGQASYYHHPEEGMTAAHRTLPFGTVVTVTNRGNGKSVKVTINDRGPYIDGRVIDLNDSAFEKIASFDTGVIDVRISW